MAADLLRLCAFLHPDLIPELLLRAGLASLEPPLQALDTDDLAYHEAVRYQKQGRYGEAEPLHQRALAIYERALGSNHPTTATALDNLAQLYQSQRRYGEAEMLYQRALAIREQALGHDHPNTAITLNNLALLYQVQGRFGEAEPLYQGALAICKNALPPNHPSTITALENYASLLQVMQRPDETLPEQHARAIRVKQQPS